MIDIQKLNFGYKTTPLYQDLSLKIGEGSIVGLLGKNGAGKSTLLKLIVGVLKADKNSQTKVMGQDIEKRHPDVLKEIFFIPETFDLPPVNIESYLKATIGYYPNFDQEKLYRILKEFDLDRQLRLNKISYGQSKKFLIAMALSSGCKLLVLDEPTNGLDIPSKTTFRKVVAGALTEQQIVLISTHQIRDVETLIDQVIVVDQGKVVLNQSIYELSKKYMFKTVRNIEKYEYLYSEPSLGGYKVIAQAEGEETDVDLETLFNAVTSGTELKVAQGTSIAQ